jgi:hypothetical protein
MGDRSLEALQKFLVDGLRGVDSVSSNPTLTARANALLGSGNGRLDAAGRLDVYREQYWLRHLSNLKDDFPTLAWVVGEESFREIAVAYLAAHPPRTWNLQRLGADLPTFVFQRAPWSSDPLALDGAQLDWAFMEAFDAADAGPVDLRAIASAPEEAWPAARIDVHPSLRTLVLSHPAHELRTALRSGAAAERPAPATTHVVVWRDPGCVLRATAVEPMAFALLGALASGRALGPACESVAREHPQGESADLDAKVGAWFQQWTSAGWVSAVRLSLGGL